MAQAKKLKSNCTNPSFDKNWEVEYFCTLESGVVRCLVCRVVLTTCSKFIIKRHYDKAHAEAISSLNEGERAAKLQLKSMFLPEAENPPVTKHTKDEKRNIVLASYDVSHLIASSSKPFSDGEYIREGAPKIAKRICPELVKQFQEVALSKQTVGRRVSDLADDLEEQLSLILKSCEWFSIALDESTHIVDTSQLIVFCRCVDDDLHVTEEMLDLISLHGTTTGEDVYNRVSECFDRNNLTWEKLASVGTDGAPSMTGVHKGFAGRVQQKMREIGCPPDQCTAEHCIVHREALSAKAVSGAMSHVMIVVVECVNFINARSLNHREFREFLRDIESEYGDVLYFSEVRWLSRGAVLNRFYDLLESIEIFMTEKGKAIPQLSEPGWIADLAFLTDLNEHLNALNLKLQGKDKLITDLRASVRSFCQKVRLWRDQAKDEGEDIRLYSNVLKSLESELNVRFADLFGSVFLDVFETPFSVNPDQVPEHLQLELIDLQNDARARSIFFFKCFV